uniref:C2H2-type domain-containing protein n=1 Tax=Parastrongyloides trichosuri TaxID=131310 RepID=A0A0N4ZKV5_PARTI
MMISSGNVVCDKCLSEQEIHKKSESLENVIKRIKLQKEKHGIKITLKLSKGDSQRQDQSSSMPQEISKSYITYPHEGSTRSDVINANSVSNVASPICGESVREKISSDGMIKSESFATSPPNLSECLPSESPLSFYDKSNKSITKIYKKFLTYRRTLSLQDQLKKFKSNTLLLNNRYLVKIYLGKELSNCVTRCLECNEQVIDAFHIKRHHIMMKHYDELFYRFLKTKGNHVCWDFKDSLAKTIKSYFPGSCTTYDNGCVVCGRRFKNINKRRDHIIMEHPIEIAKTNFTMENSDIVVVDVRENALFNAILRHNFQIAFRTISPKIKHKNLFYRYISFLFFPFATLDRKTEKKTNKRKKNQIVRI